MRWLAALPLLALPAHAQDLGGGVRYRYWDTTLKGPVDYVDQDGGPTGPLDSHVDVDQSAGLNALVAWIDAPGVGRIVGDFWWGEHEGDEVLIQETDVGGVRFHSEQDAHTVVRWRNFTGLFDYSFEIALARALPTRPRLRVGLRAGLKFMSVRGEVTVDDDTDLVSVRETFPVVGFAAELSIFDAVSLEFEGHGIATGGLIRDFRASIWDLAGTLRARLGPVTLGFGYRWVQLEVRDHRDPDSEVDADLDIRGGFVEAGLHF